MKRWSKKITLPLAVLATGMLAGAGFVAVKPSDKGGQPTERFELSEQYAMH